MPSAGDLLPIRKDMQDIMTSRNQILHDAEEYDLENFETLLLGWPMRYRIKINRPKKNSSGNKKVVSSRTPKPKQQRPAMSERGSSSSPTPTPEGTSGVGLAKGVPSPAPSSSSEAPAAAAAPSCRRQPRLHPGALRTVSILDTLAELAKGGGTDELPRADRRSLPPDLDVVATTAGAAVQPQPPPPPPKRGGSAGFDELLPCVGERDEDEGTPNDAAAAEARAAKSSATASGSSQQRSKAPRNVGRKETLSGSSKVDGGREEHQRCCAARKDRASAGGVHAEMKVQEKANRRGSAKDSTSSSSAAAFALHRGRTPEWIRSIFEMVKKGRTEQLATTLSDMDAILIRNLCDHHGNNLFHACAWTGETECLRILLRKGPICEEAVYDENKHGCSPAIIAVKRGHLNFLKCLVEKTSTRNCVSPQDGSRPLLHWVSKYGQVNILAWLLEHMANNGIDINLRDQDGNTAVHLAARYDYASCIRILASHQADMTCANNFGHKPSDTALMFGHIACAEYLMALEACTRLASNVFSMEQDLHSVKTEAMELRNYYRDVVSYLKKLVKEREELANSMNGYRDHVSDVNGQLVLALQVLTKENAALREKINGGCKNPVENSVEELVEQSNSIHQQWQDEQKRWFSSAWHSEWETRFLMAEERWRRCRTRLSRPAEPTRQPNAIASESLQQIHCQTANVKLGEAQNLSSSESSLSSDDESSSPVRTNLKAKALEKVAKQLPLPSGLVNAPKTQKFTPSGRPRGQRFATQNNGELKRVRSAPHIASPRPTPECLAKLAADVFKELGITKVALPMPDYNHSGETTCSVLEVIEPTTCEGYSSSDVRSAPLDRPPFFLGTKLNNMQSKDNSGISEVAKAEDSRNFDVREKCVSMNSFISSDGDVLNFDSGKPEGIFSVSTQDVRENVTDMCQDETNDKANLISSLLSAEPDLIKGTKGILACDDVCPFGQGTNGSGGRPESQPSFTSEDSGDSALNNLEGPVIARPKALRYVDGTSPNVLSSAKRKGFLHKFTLRWPSKRKDVKFAKKSNEISPEDFREMYSATRSPVSDEPEGFEPAHDSSEVTDSSATLDAVESQAESSLPLGVSEEQDSGAKVERFPNEENRQTDSSTSGNQCAENNTAGQTSILTLSDLATGDDAMMAEHSRVFQLRLLSSSSSAAKDGDAMVRPASSASKCESLSTRPESLASRLDLAALKAAVYPLCKASTSADMHVESSTASRMSPAPSEVSKTESALLSPPSDVSRTESIQHPVPLSRIEESITREMTGVFTSLQPTVHVKQATILDISSNKVEITSQVPVNLSQSRTLQSSGERATVVSNKKRQQVEKPWYDVSDDEDMLTPARLQRTVLHIRTSSDDDEGFLHTS